VLDAPVLDLDVVVLVGLLDFVAAVDVDHNGLVVLQPHEGVAAHPSGIRHDEGKGAAKGLVHNSKVLDLGFATGGAGIDDDAVGDSGSQAADVAVSQRGDEAIFDLELQLIRAVVDSVNMDIAHVEINVRCTRRGSQPGEKGDSGE
jgi:hypothetical protein